MNKTTTTKSTASFRKPETNTATAPTGNNNATFGAEKKKGNRKIGNLFKSKSGNPCIGIDTYPEESITLKKGQYIFLKKKENIIEQIEKDLASGRLSEKAKDFLEKRLARLQNDDKLIAELEIISE